eukprot:1146823-Pelagomonas_calceolata.AAC.1
MRVEQVTSKPDATPSKVKPSNEAKASCTACRHTWNCDDCDAAMCECLLARILLRMWHERVICNDVIMPAAGMCCTCKPRKRTPGQSGLSLSVHLLPENSLSSPEVWNSTSLGAAPKSAAKSQDEAA